VLSRRSTIKPHQDRRITIKTRRWYIGIRVKVESIFLAYRVELAYHTKRIKICDSKIVIWVKSGCITDFRLTCYGHVFGRRQQKRWHGGVGVRRCKNEPLVQPMVQKVAVQLRRNRNDMFERL
jgi:hypothetical protein